MELVLDLAFFTQVLPSWKEAELQQCIGKHAVPLRSEPN